ncbi:MAG: methylenetetrahydrofolate reductase [NAD(P)H] [Alphaproteobacteria bacterium]|jgi:methylenetetrahydrofolate reductase (NADPH)|nr:methylenetetrahydrofolate reductase [NAD(P)H] [Alphaproteobacteria bacterium]MBT4711122.1 methylenetetrahydrofolate reductase [NAD(P)H] [Alphaproteobacteria bacterium]MBT5861181.1 methylenetetrahydrofolate reductase [NAD(P)H] [Alphaproteobacteria bacterium]
MTEISPDTAENDPWVSLEFSPPKSEKMEQSLWAAIKRLIPLRPKFVSVTYGAGGSTRERTHNTVRHIQSETKMATAAHLTCVGATRSEVDQVAQDYWDSGIRHVVALRGDPPDGETSYQPHDGGYAYAADLVAGLKNVADFEISVAAYPEVHPEATSAQDDLDVLKAKVDAGATRAITQFFFDNEKYLRFVDRATAAGIDVPIVPGIMPVTNFTRVAQFADKCGASIPPAMAEAFAGLEDDPETRRQVASDLAADQCQELLDRGIKFFHFYTLNRADLTFAICHSVGLAPDRRRTTR